DNRRRDRVDVLSACRDASLRSSSSCHHVDDEDLRRTPAVVGRHGRRRIWIAKVLERRAIHEHANLRRSEMARDRDGLRERERRHVLFTERRREYPRASGRWISTLQLVVRENEAPAGITLSSQARPTRRPPAIERHRDTNLIGAVPLTHGGRCHEVAE